MVGVEELQIWSIWSTIGDALTPHFVPLALPPRLVSSALACRRSAATITTSISSLHRTTASLPPPATTTAIARSVLSPSPSTLFSLFLPSHFKLLVMSTPIDRRWMYLRKNKDGYTSLDYAEGIKNFLEFAFGNGSRTVQCPCRNCHLLKKTNKDVVAEHLMRKGFMDNYTVWYAHGETFPTHQGQSPNPIYDDDPVDGTYQMVLDSMAPTTFIDPTQPSTSDWNIDCGQPPNPDAQGFYSMLEAADQPLWEEQEGTHISPLELLVKRYTKKRKGETSGSNPEMVHPRINSFSTAYRASMMQMHGDDASTHPPVDPRAWQEAGGGVKKGHVFGVGNVSRIDYVLLGRDNGSMSRSYNCGGSSSGASEELRVIQEKMKQMEADNERLRRQVEEMQRQNQEDVESRMREVVLQMMRDGSFPYPPMAPQHPPSS